MGNERSRIQLARSQQAECYSKFAVHRATPITEATHQGYLVVLHDAHSKLIGDRLRTYQPHPSSRSHYFEGLTDGCTPANSFEDQICTLPSRPGPHPFSHIVLATFTVSTFPSRSTACSAAAGLPNTSTEPAAEMDAISVIARPMGPLPITQTFSPAYNGSRLRACTATAYTSAMAPHS